MTYPKPPSSQVLEPGLKTGSHTCNWRCEPSGHTASDSKQGLPLIHITNRAQRREEAWPGSHSFLVTVSFIETFLEQLYTSLALCTGQMSRLIGVYV